MRLGAELGRCSGWNMNQRRIVDVQRMICEGAGRRRRQYWLEVSTGQF
jgi:hypothetical protein